MSRRLSAFAPVIVVLQVHAPAAAQSTPVARPGSEGDPDCRRKQEAALISGEIVVCGDRGENDRYRLRDRDEAQEEFAKNTMDAGRAAAPDFAPPPCKPNLLTFCPKLGGVGDPAVLIDFTTLPDTPAGSDADRIGKGEMPQ